VNTYHPKVVEFWKKKKVPVKVVYELDGFPTWEIEIPDDHPALADPEYIGLALSEKMYLLPQVFSRRIRLPLYGLKVSGLPAEVADTEGKQGLALARNSGVFGDMPIDAGGVSLFRFQNAYEVYGAFRAAKERGVERVLFFVKPGVCETIPIDTALDIGKQLLH